MQLIDPDTITRPVFVLSERYGPMAGPWHAHCRAQLIHASAGVLTLHTADGRWVVPPQRAVWVPSGVIHSASSRRGFRLQTLYAVVGTPAIPDTCQVVAVDRLVEELLAAAAEADLQTPALPAETHLIQVILDRLPGLAVSPLHLPSPRDPRVRLIADALIGDLTDSRPLSELAAMAGLTPRTAARRFVTETGMTFGRWRLQLRLLTALEILGEGGNVTEAAFAVGYADVSSFIAAFRAALGTTPARYFG